MHVFNPKMGGGWKFYFPCWFSLNNSGTVKVITLSCWNIQKHLITYISAKLCVSNLPQSLYIGKNTDGAIYDFRKNS